MLRVFVLSCLILSVVGGDEALDERTGPGIQKFNVGQRQSGDKLIWSGTGNQAITFARSILMDVQFPVNGVTNTATITQIVATTDLDAGNTVFTVINGGVGQKSVTLRITSNNAHKVTYNIQIYGK